MLLEKKGVSIDIFNFIKNEILFDIKKLLFNIKDSSFPYEIYTDNIKAKFKINMFFIILMMKHIKVI